MEKSAPPELALAIRAITAGFSALGPGFDAGHDGYCPQSGLNDETVEAGGTRNDPLRTRQLPAFHSDVCKCGAGVEHHLFEEALEHAKAKGRHPDTDLSRRLAAGD